MNIPPNPEKQNVLHTNLPTTHHLHHHQISPTIFVCVHNHHTTSDNDKIEVIQLSDDDDDDDEVKNEMKTKVKEAQKCKSVSPGQLLKTLGLTCRECSELLESRSMLEQHMMKMHDKWPFKCMVRGCNRHFLKRSLLKEHSATHCTNQAKLICSAVDCQFETSIKISFANHVYLYHEKSLFQCAQCLETYPLRSMVNKHFATKHKYPQDRANKHFRCPFKACKYVGILKCRLEAHKVTHTKFKPFQCTWPNCCFAAKSFAHAIQHVRIKHLHTPFTTKEEKQRNIKWDPRQFVRQIPYDLKEELRQELNKPENSGS